MTMKSLSKALLGIYVLTLLWLVLFKFSYDLPAVLDHGTRSLNLNPFAVLSQGSLRETLDNFIVFIPFGLLLSVNFKHVSMWRKLAFIGIFSLAAEVTQFVLAIGTTDITDVIMNTAGGLFGLSVYGWVNKFVDDEKHDRFIVITMAIILMALLWLRFFVLRVRY